MEGEKGGQGGGGDAIGFGPREILRIERGDDALKVVLNPALATSEFSLLLQPALRRGVDVRLKRYDLGEARLSREQKDEESGGEREPHVTAGVR